MLCGDGEGRERVAEREREEGRKRRKWKEGKEQEERREVKGERGRNGKTLKYTHTHTGSHSPRVEMDLMMFGGACCTAVWPLNKEITTHQ